MKKKEKVYHNMSEIQEEFFPNYETIMVSKEEKEWIERHSPYRRRKKIQVEPFIDFDLENDVNMIDKVKELGKKNFLE